MIILISLGLIIIPFFVVPGYDMRTPKEYLALVFAMTIVLFQMYRGLKPFKNIGMLFFIGIACISTALIPNNKIYLNGANANGIWNYQPLFYLVVFTLMYHAIASASLTRKNILMALHVIAWCGVVMGYIVILQALECDPFGFVPVTVGNITDNPMYVGTLGNPTVVANFIALCVPIGLMVYGWIFVIPMVIATCLTGSMVGIGSMVVAVLWYQFINKKNFWYLFTPLVVLSILAVLIFPQIASGRLDMWKILIKDLTFFGHGAGAFSVFFHQIHHMGWLQAHNEYLEIWYNYGFINFVIAIITIVCIIVNVAFSDEKILKALGISFVCVCLQAFGSFPWQIFATLFYTVVVLGLIENQRGKNGQTQEEL